MAKVPQPLGRRSAGKGEPFSPGLTYLLLRRLLIRREDVVSLLREFVHDLLRIQRGIQNQLSQRVDDFRVDFVIALIVGARNDMYLLGRNGVKWAFPRKALSFRPLITLFRMGR